MVYARYDRVRARIMNPDYELLDAWKQGDARAGSALVRAHFSGLYGFFVGKVSTGEEDLVQRTFLIALERSDRYWESASFRAFLFGIARNVLLDYYAAARKADRMDVLRESSVALGVDSASQVVAAREEERLLQQAMREIPLGQQIIIELFYWEGLSHDEIAGVLGIAVGTARSRLHRARARLKDRIEAAESSPALRESTVAGLQAWAQNLRRSQPESPDSG